MSFYTFNSDDIITTEIITFPRQKVYITNGIVTGTIPLESKFLTLTSFSSAFDAPYGGENLFNKRYQGYSERLGGFVEKRGPFSASIETFVAVSGGTNSSIYGAVENLYKYYSLISSDYILTASARSK